MWLTLIISIVLCYIFYKLIFGRSKSFWKQYGVPEIDTGPALSMLDEFLGRKTMTTVHKYAYEKMGSSLKYCGTVNHGTQVFIVKDLELMKKLFIREADHFVDRRQLFTPEDGILHKMLSVLHGQEWKWVRSAVTPTFTTGKIRRMNEYFNSVAQDWVQEYTRKAKSSSSGSVIIDVNKATNQYTVEVISNTVFGIKSGVIQNPDSQFGKMANRLALFDKRQLVKIALRFIFPRLSKLFGVSIGDKEALDFFHKLLDQGLKSRMKGENKRNDFLQLLVEARKGELKAEQEELSSFEKEAQITMASGSSDGHLTDEIMNGQCIAFFFAGFSTTSSFLTFALYALALHPEIQNKLREEVDKIVKEDGLLEYDDVGKLVYLDMVTCEVLRKFPATEVHERVCTREYKDPTSGFVIPKGVYLAFPSHSVHHDKEYYEKPDEFYPEHFSPEKKAARNQYAFTPFGMGPRNCIGMRFALIEVKSALAHMVHNFIIEPTDKTPRPLQGIPSSFQLDPPKDLEVKLIPIRKE